MNGDDMRSAPRLRLRGVLCLVLLEGSTKTLAVQVVDASEFGAFLRAANRDDVENLTTNGTLLVEDQ